MVKAARPRWPWHHAGLAGMLCGLALWGTAQPLPLDLPRPFNVHDVPDRKAPEDPPDRPDLWTLDFSFKAPRTIEVDVPGRGRRIVWYLWYQVSNDTGQARRFSPRFLWVVVTPGREGAYTDEVLPTAVEKIRSLEDPQGVYPIHTSISITTVDIPHVQQFDPQGKRIAFPEYVTGVATWIVATPEEVPRMLKQPQHVRSYLPSDFTDFYIYVFGLSNGFVQIDGLEGKPITKVKALRLKFKRRGDEFRQNSDQIEYVGYDWVYAEQPQNQESRGLPFAGQAAPNP
ncbi:hypothetical protein HRbin36_02044 [bacterium HR36]|nr:hypothetical protein HRbin36_02044 [bacterium HR36]